MNENTHLSYLFLFLFSLSLLIIHLNVQWARVCYWTVYVWNADNTADFYMFAVAHSYDENLFCCLSNIRIDLNSINNLLDSSVHKCIFHAISNAGRFFRNCYDFICSKCVEMQQAIRILVLLILGRQALPGQYKMFENLKIGFFINKNNKICTEEAPPPCW